MQSLSSLTIPGDEYRIWTETHGLEIGGANEAIRAVLLPSSEAKHFQTKGKSPAFEVVSVGYLDDETPLWWERTGLIKGRSDYVTTSDYKPDAPQFVDLTQDVASRVSRWP